MKKTPIIGHPGLEPGSMTTALEWTPGQVQGDDKRADGRP